jgi:pimeloyl-ACP methyl ester carboxylesterase
MAEVGVNGATLRYERAGSGPPVLFCHGERCDRREWAVQRDALIDDFEVITVDLPGHGETGESAREDLSIATLTADIRELLRELGTVPAVLVGRSLGARIAYQLAAHHDDLIRGLVAVNPLPPVLQSSSRIRLAGYGWAIRIAPYVGWHRLFSVHRWICRSDYQLNENPGIPELGLSIRDYLGSAEAMVNNREYAKFARGLRDEMAAVAPVRVPFGLIDVPTLAVVGEAVSSSILDTANRLIEVVPESSEKVVLNGTGWIPQLEDPRAFTTRLREFLENHVDNQAATENHSIDTSAPQ